MSEPSRIERRSLEAHVELCAKRYNYLETHLDSLEAKISKVEATADQVLELVQRIENQRNNRLISWGVGIIAALFSALGWLLTTYVFK